MLEDTIHEWVQLSEQVRTRSADPFARFALLWIAFNTYYAFRHGRGRRRNDENTDWQELQELADSHEFTQVHATLLKARDGRYLDAVDTLVRAERATDNVLRSGLHRDATDPVAILKAVYRIRCNLFHGLKSPSDVLDRNVVEAANTIVALFLRELVPFRARRTAV